MEEGCIKGLLGILVVVIFLAIGGSWAQWCFRGAVDSVTPFTPTHPPIHGVTPAEVTIDYSFRLEADGPLRIIAPGCPADGTYTPGKGLASNCPSGYRQAGPIRILSADPQREFHFRVWETKPCNPSPWQRC
jgi:hypothetical protein